MKKIILLITLTGVILFPALVFTEDITEDVEKSSNAKSEIDSVKIEGNADSTAVKGRITHSTLAIQLENLKNNKGNLIVSIFKDADAFPVKPKKAYRTRLIKLAEIENELIVIDSLGFGVYAVSIIHDEDDNGEMKTNFLGMPKEGVGVSNNAKGSFGPPKFKDAKFDFTPDLKTISIKIKY